MLTIMTDCYHAGTDRYYSDMWVLHGRNSKKKLSLIIGLRRIPSCECLLIGSYGDQYEPEVRKRVVPRRLTDRYHAWTDRYYFGKRVLHRRNSKKKLSLIMALGLGRIPSCECLLIGSYGDQYEPGVRERVVSRRVRATTGPFLEGVADDLDIIQDCIQQDPHKKLSFVFADVPGAQCSRLDYLYRIRKFLETCKTEEGTYVGTNTL